MRQSIGIAAVIAVAVAGLWAWTVSNSGANARVTSSHGISTAELSSQTMMSKRLPGLFVIGEAVDVTGWLGGYNFQWAWASAHAAAQVL